MPSFPRPPARQRPRPVPRGHLRPRREACHEGHATRRFPARRTNRAPACVHGCAVTRLARPCPPPAATAARGFGNSMAGRELPHRCRERARVIPGRSGPGRTTARPGRLAMGEALTIEVRHEQGYAIVTAAGEIDISTATPLRERLFELAASGRPAGGRPGPGQLHRLRRACRAGRHGQARRRARRQPVCGLRPAEDPPVVPPDRAGLPDTAGPHPGRGPGRPWRPHGPAS